jgi:hypothetical protein
MTAYFSVRLILDREAQSLRVGKTVVTWSGKGDTQVVPEEIARKATEHSDVFEVLAEVKGKKTEKAVQIEEVEDLEEKEKAEMPSLVDINMMDKAALTAYALREFGQQIDAKWSAERARKLIQDLMGQKLYGRG